MITREVMREAIFKTIKKGSCHISPDIHRACEKAIADEKHDDRHGELVKELVGVMAGTGSEWSRGSGDEAVITTTSKTSVGGTIQVNAYDKPTARLDLHSVPWDAAKRICAILAECRSV